MSSPKAPKTIASPGLCRRDALRGIFSVLVLGPTLGACEGGIRPMYGSLGGAGVEVKLAQVDIASIPGRTGQRIRNELLYQRTGGGAALPPNYRLEVTIKETVTTTLVTREGELLGQVYHIDAIFQLVSLSDKRTVLQGTSHGRASFERFTSVFSNVRANDEAQNRAAKTIATDLKARLTAYLATSA